MKFEELPTRNEHGRELEMENAMITSVSLSIEDHGVLSGWVFIEFSGGGCGFGGYVLGKRGSNNLSGKNFAAEFIVRCCETIGAEKWELLQGMPLRTLHEGIGGGIVAIGHFLKDKWFSPKIEWKDEK